MVAWLDWLMLADTGSWRAEVMADVVVVVVNMGAGDCAMMPAGENGCGVTILL